MQRSKGQRVEREMVAAHKAMGVHAERVPLSGGAHYQGGGHDVDIYAFGKDEAPLVCEVKARKSGAGFKTLTRWLGENDALFLKANNEPAVAVVPWRVWVRLIGKEAA